MRKSRTLRPLADRLWAKVEKTDTCWLWTGALQQGYGRMFYAAADRHPRLAHRVAWELTHGPIPDGMFILHHCDNPRCVRPDHLFLGSQLDNMRDRSAKGRAARLRGELQGGAKLTWEKARQIRILYATGDITQDQLATRFNVGPTAIYDVLRNHTWQEGSDE